MVQDLLKQIDRAFDNVEHTLGLAGAGWKDVYAVKLYHTEITEEGVGHLVENMRKYMPDHQPILSGIGVTSLAFGMKLEIEVRGPRAGASEIGAFLGTAGNFSMSHDYGKIARRMKDFVRPYMMAVAAGHLSTPCLSKDSGKIGARCYLCLFFSCFPRCPLFNGNIRT